MSITIEIPAQDIAAIKQLTHIEGDAEAVVQAVREFVRLVRLRELKSVSGKVDYDPNSQPLEDLEFGEASFPQ